MKTAVLLIAFSRPEPTRQVFEAVRAARPPRLYVAVDGPRRERPDDLGKIAAVREIVSLVDWPCELKTCFREQNLGCGRGPAAAIDWFFDHEPAGIILEDDCLPLPGFFRFCDELLERYADDESIAQICGSSFVPGLAGNDSYYFTKYADIWGWATWRRSWRKADLAMSGWPSWRDAGGLTKLPGSTPAFVAYWTGIFDAMHERGVVDIWDYQWMYSCWRAGLTSISPRRTLIRNIGFGDGATHHIDPARPSYMRPSDQLEFPLSHPAAIRIDPGLERAIARHRYFIRPISELATLVHRVPWLGPPAVSLTKRLRAWK